MLHAAFSVKQRISVGPSGQPEKKAPGSDWHAPRTALFRVYWGPLGPGEDEMQHQTGKWIQESHPHSLPWDGPWSLEQDLALEGHGPGQFRTREH